MIYSFSETKDDGITPEQIKVINFRKQPPKENALAFICAKS